MRNRRRRRGPSDSRAVSGPAGGMLRADALEGTELPDKRFAQVRRQGHKILGEGVGKKRC